MKLFLVTYQTKRPDYDAIVEKARKFKVKLEFGGGRKTKGGESPNAQMIFNLKDIRSKISISRTGKVIIYYPSKPLLEKSLEILKECYVPTIERSDLECQGPVDPLSKAFELRTTENWKGMGLTLAEATVVLHQWFDPKTAEYIFVLPNDDGQVVPPADPDLIYSGSSPVTIKTIDRDDEHGNRIVTAERVRWKAMKELKRMAKEHRLKPEDLERARRKRDDTPRHVDLSSSKLDLIFEC